MCGIFACSALAPKPLAHTNDAAEADVTSIKIAQAESVETGTTFLWLELTHKCNIECTHCYTASSPRVEHGAMGLIDWLRVLDQARDMGINFVQFIGGEPTMHPDLSALIDAASERGMIVEVYTNLVSVSEQLWTCFAEHQVRLATSVYGSEAEEHDSVTTRRGSFSRTVSNLERAQSLGLAVRTGVVAVSERQNLPETVNFLGRAGVTSVRTDRMRIVGRPAETTDMVASVDELCGACTRSVAAIDPDGNVHPCIMARSFTAGNVRDSTLNSILSGELIDHRRQLDRGFAARSAGVGSGTETVDCFPQTGCEPTCPPMLQNCPPVQNYCPPNDPSLCPPNAMCPPQTPRCGPM